MKRLFLVLLLCFCSIRLSAAEANKTEKKMRIQKLYDYHEKQCIEKGWQKIGVFVEGIERNILWKGPESGWNNGVIIVLHGGGGTYSNFCSNIPLGKPMVDFGELAIQEGFAVFSPDSTNGLSTDFQGNACGKRWDSLTLKGRENIDLPFIEKVITETMPSLRPANSNNNVFIAGISNGGYMTILASTHFDDMITAFAPVSTGDPYGTYMRCDEDKQLRPNAPGKFRDSETGNLIAEDQACSAEYYPNEMEWQTANPAQKPAFKQFHHEGDAGVDISCMKKARKMLRQHGYRDEGPSIVKRLGKKRLLFHFWLNQYNRPLIEFFKKHSKNVKNNQPIVDSGTIYKIPIVKAYSAGDHDFSLIHDGLKRIYKVHVPRSYNIHKKIPVVLAFHGGGGDAEGSVKYFDLNTKADEEGFIAVYPEGTGKIVDGKLFGSWNAGRCCPPAMDNHIDDVGFISNMIDQLKSDFQIDEKRIYATGMSNGALMSYRLACELSEKIAAIAPSGGHDALDRCQPSRPVPVLHIHGKEDPCAFYEGGSCGGCIAKFLNKLNIPAQPHTWACGSVPEYVDDWKQINECSDDSKVIYQNRGAVCNQFIHCKNDSEITLCTVESMGHVWPGHKTYSAKACKTNPEGYFCGLWVETVGSLSDDIIANDLIWDFFKKHPMEILPVDCGDGLCSKDETKSSCPIDCNETTSFGRFSIAKAQINFDDEQKLKDIFLELGATNWRTQIFWEQVEPEQGVTYDWSLFEKWLIPNVDNTILIHPGLTGGYNFWGIEDTSENIADGWHNTPVKKEYEQNYINFVKAAYVKANEITNGRAKIWQVSAEVESPGHWVVPDENGVPITDNVQRAEAFVHLMNLTYTAIKEIDSEAIVIGCSHYGGWDSANQRPKNYNFMTTCLDEGRNYYDGFDERLYGLWENIPAKYQWYKNFWNEKGISGKKLYGTEGGGPWTGKEVFDPAPNCDYGSLEADFISCRNDICPDQNDLDNCYPICQNFCTEFESCINSVYLEHEKTKSEEVIKRYVLGFANGMEFFSWFKLPESSSKNLRACTLFVKGGSAPFFARMALLNQSLELKYPAFYTYQLAQQKLDYFTSVETLSLGNDYGFKFSFSNKNPIYVLWSESGVTVDLSPYISSQDVKVIKIVTELDGSNNPIYLNDEVVSVNAITLSETPVFVEEN